MVAQRFNRNNIQRKADEYDNEELIYVNKKKEEEEDELLVPVLLESMFEAHSPTALNEFPKVEDISDDSTAALTSTGSSSGTSTTVDLNYDISPITESRIADYLMIPELDSEEPELNSTLSFSDEPAVITTEYDMSPRTVVVPTTNERDHPFNIPEDVRYNGQVIFATSTGETSINLHPKPLDKGAFESIFMHKSIQQENHNVYHVYIEDERGDRRCNDYSGVEESKEDEDDCRCNFDEGFAYVYGEQRPEEDYWQSYLGHYGSLDMEEDVRMSYDYTCRKHSKTNFCHSYVSYPRNTNSLSASESLIGMFTNMFACGEYGKPFASASSTCSLPYPCAIAGLTEDHMP